MHCVKCGRALAQEAKFCGVCGQPVVGERPAQPSKQPSGRTSQAGCAVAVLGLVLALAFCTGSDEAGEPASNEARVVDLKACEAVLTAARSLELIKDQPAKTRVDVEDALWSRLSAKEKLSIAAAVDCIAYGQRKPSLSDAPAVVYGFRSGKRLAMVVDGVPRLE